MSAEEVGEQCDQIGRFFGFWATFKSLFVKVSKSFLGKFYRHLATFY